jgi:hypothetical protein
MENGKTGAHSAASATSKLVMFVSIQCLFFTLELLFFTLDLLFSR